MYSPRSTSRRQRLHCRASFRHASGQRSQSARRNPGGLAASGPGLARNAAGTLAVSIGSGLQAGSELRRYGAVARQLGLAEAGAVAVEVLQASMRVYGGFYVPVSLWPQDHCP
jgi:hypothetical protein